MLLFPNRPAVGLISTSVLCLLAIGLIDHAASRSQPVYVEEFWQEGLTYEEILLEAVNEAYARSHSGWWLRSARAQVALPVDQLDQIDPALLAVMNLQFTSAADTLLIAELDQ